MHEVTGSNTSNKTRLLTVVEAIAEATSQAMDADERVFVYGLDVDDHKRIQGSTAGLVEKFGPSRCFSTPLSEDAMTGVGIGAAMAGMRPIHVHIRMDFLLLCMNQLINMAAKSSYMTGGQVKVPMVIRTMIGRSWGQGAQHSQSLQSLFMHIPGLRVVAPSNAHDAKGCLTAAINDDNPVIFIEHRLLCNQQSFVSKEPFVSEIGTGRTLAEGSDITIVAISHMVNEAMRAKKYLEDAGISAEIIDPIWLKPLDIEPIIKSTKKTKNLLVVDNGWLTCGAAGEILTQVVTELSSAQSLKDCSFARLGFAETTCPTTRVLEDLFYPNGKTIAIKACQMLGNESDLSWLPKDAAGEEIDAFKGPF